MLRMSSPMIISALVFLLAVVFYYLEPLRASSSKQATPRVSRSLMTHPIVTDLKVYIGAPTRPEPDPKLWQRIDKELYLGKLEQRAWLYVAVKNEQELTAETKVVTDIRVGDFPSTSNSSLPWENRNGGIWVQRSKYNKVEESVTAVDVLFGKDAVDPRPQWTLMESSLQLDANSNIPIARLSILYGRAMPRVDPPALRVRGDGTFKIVQISDTHMVTGVGVCKDAIDSYGKHLPESEADPLTVEFIARILDTEKPDLVVLTGDQLHHDIDDSQTALLKVVAPIIERSVPFAAVFGNHDSEGKKALSRIAQMSLLQDLPFSYCKSGPEQVEGIGNFYIEVLAPPPSELTLATLYFLDSHGQIPRMVCNPDYDPIKQSQIDWFRKISSAQRCVHDKDNGRLYLSLAFQHIPLPEFKGQDLIIYSGHRGEPTECPRVNSHFYDALVEGGVSALGCGHDHVNDFCALLSPKTDPNSQKTYQNGPWLCYGGASGFGGYCSYGKKRFHRRMRIWQLETNVGVLKTWIRTEYAQERVGELVLIQGGAVEQPAQGLFTNGQ
ncbi:Metallo-dependent phosphatase [Pyrenochaeta sp. DS3sAY3a]|nr:Metallo-dependent phosphatase [Pyrenochaeta sp. DS3sAY3a]